MQKKSTTYLIQSENELDTIDIPLAPGERIFFVGDLGAGKSTLIRHMLRKYFSHPGLVVRSPTYTYSQVYQSDSLDRAPVVHFDLYRLDDLGVWMSIGGEEVALDPKSIMLIEWPEVLGDTIIPTQKVSITLLEGGVRQIQVEDFRIEE